MSRTGHALYAVRVQQSALGMVRGAGGDGQRSSLQQRVVLKIATKQMHGPADKPQRFKMLHTHVCVNS